MTRWYLGCALMFGVAVATHSAAQPAPCPTPASTFELIQRGVFEQHGCTQDFCHGASMQAGLDLRAGASYQSLLSDAQSAHPAADGPNLVQPGRPQQSLLWLLLAAKTFGLPNPPGTPMPIGAKPLTNNELEAIRLWIVAGAPQQGTLAGIAALIDACPQSSGEDDSNLPTCDPNDPTLLLPELAPEAPSDIRFTTQDGHRMIYFSTVIANSGAGPFIIQAATTPTKPDEVVDAEQVLFRQDGSKCVHSAGVMRWQQSSNGNRGGWQYTYMANFELRKDDPENGDIFALRSKAYLCLLDTDIIKMTSNAPIQYDAHCYDNIGRMGISAGWKDTYHRVFPGQWIDLDADPEEAVAPGNYYLVNIANPTGVLWEKDPSLQSNLSYTRVRITAADPDPSVQPTPSDQPTPPLQPTPAVQPTPTPGLHQHPVRTRVVRPLHPSRLPPTPTPDAGAAPRHPAPPAHPHGPSHPGTP